MAKRKKKEHDFSITAFRVVQEATGQTEEEANHEEKKFDPVALGHLGGLKGAKLGPHTIRHSSALLVAKDTHNAMAVKALLQHDNIQTSMLYVHDVEDEILKGESSPLQLVADNVKESGLYQQKQLVMKASPDSSDVEVVDDGFDEVVRDMFPEIREGAVVRPSLGMKDLNLIRKGFIEMAASDKYSRDVARARDLMKRMLRKVK